MSTSTDRWLLGIALTRLGRLDEALSCFEPIDPQRLWRAEEPYYYNEFANLLRKMGRLNEGQALLRPISRDRWPESQKRWAEQFLALPKSGESPPVRTQ